MSSTRQPRILPLLLLVVCLLVGIFSGISDALTLGSTYYSIKSTTLFYSGLEGDTSQGIPAYTTQSLTASGAPFTTINSGVAVVFIPAVATDNPAEVSIYLCAPNGYCAYAVMLNTLSTNTFDGCDTLTSPTILDNQTTQWETSSSAISCTGGSAFTGYGLTYFQKSGSSPGTSLCLGTCTTSTSHGSTTITGGTPDSNPFNAVFSMGSGAVAGTWTVGIQDNSPDVNAAMQSWEVRFYRKSFFLSLLPTCNDCLLN